jgi:fluoride exporter
MSAGAPYWALVALGGAAGAVARYGVSAYALRTFGPGFPWGTLIVNVIGGLAMGVLFALYGDKRASMALLGAGVLGGFTTFSAFSLETVRMMETGRGGEALAYVSVSVIASCAAVWVGLSLARMWS